jgi:hypothetical protein
MVIAPNQALHLTAAVLLAEFTVSPAAAAGEFGVGGAGR